MINTPYGGYPLLHQKYMQTVAQLTLPFYDIKPSMPSIGGGVHPGMVEKYIREVGKDVVRGSRGSRSRDIQAVQQQGLGQCARRLRL